jgi:hypothetical protein
VSNKSDTLPIGKNGRENIIYERPKKTPSPAQLPVERREQGTGGGPERHG